MARPRRAGRKHVARLRTALLASSALVGVGIALPDEARAQCTGTTCTVASEADLRIAIAHANTIANTTINLNTAVTLTTGDLPALQGTGTTISGNGNTLNGGNSFRGLLVYSGTTRVENLTIANAVAQGGDGGGRGGGGAGLGGALFVNSGATVTVSNVALQGNRAAGGTSLPNVLLQGGGGGMGGNGAGGNGGGGGLGRGANGGAPGAPGSIGIVGGAARGGSSQDGNLGPFHKQLSHCCREWGIHKGELLDVASQNDSICAGAICPKAIQGDGSCLERAEPAAVCGHGSSGARTRGRQPYGADFRIGAPNDLSRAFRHSRQTFSRARKGPPAWWRAQEQGSRRSNPFGRSAMHRRTRDAG